MHPFEALLQGERLPPLRRIQYDLPSPRLKDPAAVLRRELRASGVLRPLRPGQTVAIAAGSREITNLALLVRTLIAALQEKGARPFLVPAMGSHGGATAEGQREILRGCRLMWIQDTNHLGEFYVSPALLPEAEQNPLLRVLPGTFEVDYAPDGNVAGFVPAVP